MFGGVYFAQIYFAGFPDLGEAIVERRMVCAAIAITPRISGSPSISPALDAAGVSVEPTLTGTVTIEEC